MAEITRKRTGELLRRLFEILKASPEGLPARVALERLANAVQLTEYEKGMYNSGSRRSRDKIVRFATVDCVKAGWLIKNKGTWTLTDAGLEAHKMLTDPETFYKEAVRLYHVWKKSQPGTADDTDELSTDVLADAADKSRASPSSKQKSKPGQRSKRTSDRWTRMSSRNSLPICLKQWATMHHGLRHLARTEGWISWHTPILSAPIAANQGAGEASTATHQRRWSALFCIPSERR